MNDRKKELETKLAAVAMDTTIADEAKRVAKFIDDRAKVEADIRRLVAMDTVRSRLATLTADFADADHTISDEERIAALGALRSIIDTIHAAG